MNFIIIGALRTVLWLIGSEHPFVLLHEVRSGAQMVSRLDDGYWSMTAGRCNDGGQQTATLAAPVTEQAV
jgi:hypothetical protein